GFTLAHEPLLRRGGYKFARTGEQGPPAKGPSSARAWAILGVKQPVVGPEAAVKPDGMVEARQHQGLIENEAAMGDQRRIEQSEIRGVGEDTLVEREVVTKASRRPNPDMLA